MKLLMRIKTHIDNTTMYRTVLYGLMALTVWSWLFGFLGLINFFPIAMVIQLLIAIGVGYAVDRLMAYIFKVRPNPESMLITSFIVYFLILPNGTIANFVLTALVMVFAGLSKYLVIWRGKHIFNPAALGVALIGIVGLGYAGWWVATPWLLPIVAILGAVTVYKTRRTDMVLLYLGVSVAMIVLLALIKGTFEPSLFLMAFTSFPLVFFACFMLTEPQTLAPKRLQRNIIAVGVAVLANSHLTLGPLSTSPETVLLLANLATVVLAGQRSLALTLQGRRKLPGDQVEYIFTAHKQLSFEAGQYVELHVPHVKSDSRGFRRMFTIASRPGTNDVTIITRQPHPASSFKKTLAKLPIGRNVRVTGVWGDFTLPREQNKKLLFVAGGVGITPFLSHLSYIKHNKQTRDIVLIYAVKNAAEAIELDAFKEHANIIIHEGILTSEHLQRYSSDIAQRSVYVSGPPNMVDAITKQAKQLGAPSVHRDFFAGY